MRYFLKNLLSSQIHTDRKWNGGCQEQGEGGLLISGVEDEGRWMEMDDGW